MVVSDMQTFADFVQELCILTAECKNIPKEQSSFFPIKSSG